MILLLSGEGPSDIGQSSHGGACRGDKFDPGPMALLIEQLLESCLNYQVLEHSRAHDADAVRFVDETTLGQWGRDAVKSQKEMLLPGERSPLGTIHFRKSALVLGRKAREIEVQENDCVVAVLSRDSDITQSSPRNIWQKHRDSMINGFLVAEFEGGVAMMPRPKSEAWLLCALKKKYHHFDSLEDEPGNDDSPKNLKRQLSEHLKGKSDTQSLNGLVVDGKIVAHQIQMPSFLAFRESLKQAASRCGLDISSLEMPS